MPDDVAQRWGQFSSVGRLLASAVPSCAVAGAPLLLGSVGVPAPVQQLAAGFTALLVILAVTTVIRPLPAVTGWIAAIGAGCLLTFVTARVADRAPLPAAVLTCGFLAACMLVGPRGALAGVIGVALGIVVASAGWPTPSPPEVNLGLSIEPSYAGTFIAPAWFRLDRVLAVAAIDIIVAALAVAVAARPWRARIRRYAALGRVVQARGRVSPSQGALAVTALADSRWTLIGIGVVQWEALRIIAARSPGDRQAWRHFIPALRGATIPLSHESNPLIRAARQAQSTEIRSGSEVTLGMRHAGAAVASDAVSRARGRAVPFGDVVHRGVLFALSDSSIDFEWLDDLAGALAVLGVGKTHSNRLSETGADR